MMMFYSVRDSVRGGDMRQKERERGREGKI